MRWIALSSFRTTDPSFKVFKEAHNISHLEFSWLVIQLVTKDPSLGRADNRHGIYNVSTIASFWQLKRGNGGCLSHVPEF